MPVVTISSKVQVVIPRELSDALGLETPGSHAVYVSHPEPVAKLIAHAAAAVSVAASKLDSGGRR